MREADCILRGYDNLAVAPFWIVCEFVPPCSVESPQDFNRNLADLVEPIANHECNGNHPALGMLIQPSQCGSAILCGVWMRAVCARGGVASEGATPS